MGIFDDYEAERLAAMNTPEALAEEARMAKRSAERFAEQRALAVRMGWSDEDGNSLLPEDTDEDEDDGEA
jgi:hypothetical protein